MSDLTALIDLARQLGLLCAVFALLIVVREAAEKRAPRFWQVAAGLTLGGAAIVSMSAPVVVAPGIIVDPRAAILVWAVPVGGWPAGVVAAVTAVGFRIGLGGPGWLAGTSLIVAAIGLGAVAGRGRAPDFRRVGALSVLIVIPTLASFLLIRPFSAGLDALARTGPAIVLVSIVGTAVLGALIVIDERRRSLLVRAERSEAEARRLAEAEAAFVADVGHEIRAPMSGILGFTAILERTALDPYQAHCVGQIRTAGGRLMRLIDDILDNAKGDAGTLAIASAPIELASTLEGAVALVEGTAAAKGLDLDLRIAPDTPRRVMGDADRLAQILLNLLTNAVKFTERGRIDVTVDRWVDADGTSRGIRIEVADTGIGIPEADLDTVFDRFRRVEAGAKGRPGSGLGLGIARRLARAMDGDLRLRSAPGAGTRATVDLALPAAGPDEGAPAAPRRPAADSGAAAPRRVLLAEDDPMNQEVVRALLGNAGHRVETTADGRAAVTRALEGGWDVVLMDLRLPGLDGVQAIRRIRAVDAATPIIVFSGDPTAAARRRVEEAGADGMLVKPASPAALLETVATAGRPGGATPADAPDRLAGASGAVDATADLTRLLGPERAASLVAQTRRHVATAFADLDADQAPRDLAARAHGLIGPAGTVFGRRGVAALRALETAAAGGDPAAIRRAIARLRDLERMPAPVAPPAGDGPAADSGPSGRTRSEAG